MHNTWTFDTDVINGQIGFTKRMEMHKKRSKTNNPTTSKFKIRIKCNYAQIQGDHSFW